MPKTKKGRKQTWSKIIEERGQRVRIFERARGGPIYRAVVVGLRENSSGRIVSKLDIASLKTRDRTLAEDRARELAAALVKQEIVPTGDARQVTLSHVFEAYRQHFKIDDLKQPSPLSIERRQWARSRMPLFEKAWGPDLVLFEVRIDGGNRTEVSWLNQNHVDEYCAQRRAGTLTPLEQSKPGKGRRPVKVKDGTLSGDFRWLSSCFNWAHGRRTESGYRLLPENPLHDVKLPREKQPRQPVSSHARYVATQLHTDAVDPAGRLRCVLALARYTGRRESAICSLRASDVLLTEASVRGALAKAGLNEETRDGSGAELYPFGAIYWSPEHDKQKLLHITPLDQHARTELDHYLRENPRVGDVPLFPAPGDASAPMRRDVISKWLIKAEALAGQPKLAQGAFHPYRRLWASERQHIADVAVAAAGGWSDTRAMKQSYQKASPADVLRAVQRA